MERSWASRIVVLMHTFTLLSQIVLIDGESYVYDVTFVCNWSVHQKWIQKKSSCNLKTRTTNRVRWRVHSFLERNFIHQLTCSFCGEQIFVCVSFILLKNHFCKLSMKNLELKQISQMHVSSTSARCMLGWVSTATICNEVFACSMQIKFPSKQICLLISRVHTVKGIIGYSP